MGTDGKLERAIAVVPPEGDAAKIVVAGETEEPKGRGSPLLGAIRFSALIAFRC